MKAYRFLASLKHGDVEKLPSEKDCKALASLRYQEKLNTFLKEMYKVELSGASGKFRILLEAQQFRIGDEGDVAFVAPTQKDAYEHSSRWWLS